MTNQINHIDLLSEKRFELDQSDVHEKLAELKDHGLINENQFERVVEEDILLKIKHRTYKRCRIQVVIGIGLISIGFLVHTGLVYLFAVFGGILLVSSLFGMKANKLSKVQINYLTK